MRGFADLTRGWMGAFGHGTWPPIRVDWAGRMWDGLRTYHTKMRGNATAGLIAGVEPGNVTVGI